jgi:nicotinamidase-related amidase
MDLPPMTGQVLAEITEPGRAGLLVIDMQNDDCRPQGKWASLGSVEMIQTVINNLQRLLPLARDRGVQVIWLRNVWRTGTGYQSLPASYLRFLLFKCGFHPGDRLVEEGSWGAELVPELVVQPQDIEVIKTRSSGFIGTDLDLFLRSNGFQTLLIAGVATQACVESTVRSAVDRDYQVVILRDCVGAYKLDLHEASLRVMRSFAEVVSMNDLLAEWDRGNQQTKRREP